MVRKVAAALALLMFAVCVGAGLNAGNTFSTVLSNALLGMGAAFGVGLVVGAMAQKMLDENLASEAKKLAPGDAGPPGERGAGGTGAGAVNAGNAAAGNVAPARKA
jgi:hypothetical protein